MKSQKDWFVNYHEHDSLLENKIGEELDEEERKAAWDEYENERKGVLQMRQNFMGKQHQALQLVTKDWPLVSFYFFIYYEVNW